MQNCENASSLHIEVLLYIILSVRIVIIVFCVVRCNKESGASTARRQPHDDRGG
jgi:hypothetical protein